MWQLYSVGSHPTFERAGGQMKIRAIVLTALIGGYSALAASMPKNPGTPAQMVVTVQPVRGAPQQRVEPADIKVNVANIPTPVMDLQRLSGRMAKMQLFVLLDDSTRSSSLGIQLPELKRFVRSLPDTTQVAIGYMRNGTFTSVQKFTTDHERAADSLRLPAGVPGGNGSPYFALSDLTKHWPSQEPTVRRAVLMMTDGVDPYYSNAIMDDPYVDEAVHGAVERGIMVYSIYLHGAGVYGQSGWIENTAQSRLIEVSRETGGFAYWQGFGDPVSISPFLRDFRERLENQYQVTIGASNEKGFHAVKYQTELPGVKIEGPGLVDVR